MQWLASFLSIFFVILVSKVVRTCWEISYLISLYIKLLLAWLAPDQQLTFYTPSFCLSNNTAALPSDYLPRCTSLSLHLLSGNLRFPPKCRPLSSRHLGHLYFLFGFFVLTFLWAHAIMFTLERSHLPQRDTHSLCFCMWVCVWVSVFFFLFLLFFLFKFHLVRTDASWDRTSLLALWLKFRGTFELFLATWLFDRQLRFTGMQSSAEGGKNDLVYQQVRVANHS